MTDGGAGEQMASEVRGDGGSGSHPGTVAADVSRAYSSSGSPGSGGVVAVYTASNSPGTSGRYPVTKQTQGEW